MHLKRLELSGFKSFAKTTTLEFPSRVTAIVGPNGSGKSNIKEAIQWALGEQSMKSLRGKKGEDLVWNGSPEVARMGKASVTLVFDNADKKIPLEFDEVAIQRKIFRDGAGEYAINNSPVRLKDVVELCARMGLGESRHNIIGQGEVDRLLLALPKDRYHLLEEALGLRVYHLKKNEAERKLEATRQNIVQAEAVIREIVPHLKFLRATAHRAGNRDKLEAELRNSEGIYFAREEIEIAALKSAVAGRAVPLAQKEQASEKEIARLSTALQAAERALSSAAEISQAERNLYSLQEKRRDVERRLGWLEGKMEAEKKQHGEVGDRATDPAKEISSHGVDVGYLYGEIRNILAAARLVVKEEDRLDVMRSRLALFCEELERLTSEIKEGRAAGVGIGSASPTPPVPQTSETEEAIKALHLELAALALQTKKYTEAREEETAAGHERHARIREIDRELRKKQDSAREAALERQKIAFEEERIRMREEEFSHELATSGMSREDISRYIGQSTGDTREELRKKIERLRIRLEEIGAIDPATIKEYEDTEARHAFLEGELEDLKHASASLRDLIRELEHHIKKDFRDGFAHIKDAFSEYFQVVFGGGKAVLRITKQEARSTDGDDGEELNEAEDESEGVEIEVGLPRKRITGLAMLSGGERALASIALLFAISAVNPPPFLILDETDAALDEANSERFSALLKELSKKTQLLVITHNRETMKAAGILYGVTMGHDGVSKLLSLKLEQAEVYTNR